MFELLFTHPLWAYRTGVFAFASAWPLWLLVVSIIAVAVLIAASLVYVGQRRQLGWHLLLPVGILQSLLAAAVLCLLWRPVLNVERVRDRENVLAVAIDASASMAYGAGERDAPGTLQNLNERVADARLRPGRRDRFERVQRRRGLREAEQAHLERVFQLRERSIL